jgi:hypothetical protein
MLPKHQVQWDNCTMEYDLEKFNWPAWALSVVQEAAAIITRAKGLEIDWKSLPGNYGSVKRRCPDITKLKRLYPLYNPKKFKYSIQDLWKQNNES